MELIVALEAFVRAAERLSFSAAARDLMTSQPHITRAVSQLESRLGAQLFQRSTRRLTLTDEGIEYLAHARAILASIDNADRSVGRRAGKLTGQLRVFAPVSLGRAWIVPRLRDFMLQYPDLNVHLVLDDRPRDLIEERLDVGIRIGPLQDSTLRVRTLGEVGYSIVAATEFWKQHGKPKTVDALARLPAIIFDGTIRADQFTLSDGIRTEILYLSGRLSTNSSEAMVSALDSGLGYSVVPNWLLSQSGMCGRLECALPEWRPEQRLSLLAVFAGSRLPTERVRRFIDWLVFALGTDGLLNVE